MYMYVRHSPNIDYCIDFYLYAIRIVNSLLPRYMVSKTLAGLQNWATTTDPRIHDIWKGWWGIQIEETPTPSVLEADLGYPYSLPPDIVHVIANRQY